MSRVLVIAAHPDDEVLGASAILTVASGTNVANGNGVLFDTTVSSVSVKHCREVVSGGRPSRRRLRSRSFSSIGQVSFMPVISHITGNALPGRKLNRTLRL